MDIQSLSAIKKARASIEAKIDNKLTPVQQDMKQLVADVQAQVKEMQTIVENSPAGGAPPMLSSMWSQSLEEGIELTYTANAVENSLTDDKVSNYNALTKGVMFRYSNTNYPVNIDEGTLAFIDEDLFDISDVGVRTAKEKTKTIVGLTYGETYYISAFPYSYHNVYNITSGTATESARRNRTKCTWNGPRCNLTVKVTQDYDYMQFGEYTITVTPIAGGETFAKTQTGEATVVFKDIKAGDYLLSFSKPRYFTPPQNQTVKVIGGYNQTINAEFNMSNDLNDYSWEELSKLSKNNQASNIFSVGSVKQIDINYITGKIFSQVDTPSYSSRTINVQLVDINKDTDNDDPVAKRNTMTFITEGFAGYISYEQGSVWGSSSLIHDFFQKNREKIFPSDLCHVMCLVYKKTGFMNKAISPSNDYVFIPSISELSITPYANLEESPKNYSYFSDSSRRIKSENGVKKRYWTRSTMKSATAFGLLTINEDGDYDRNDNYNKTNYLPLGFCI